MKTITNPAEDLDTEKATPPAIRPSIQSVFRAIEAKRNRLVTVTDEWIQIDDLVNMTK